jgi:predicted dehydrogenase
MKKRIGIIGAGSICAKYLEIFEVIKQAQVVAITSRTRSKAEKIKKDFKIPHVYNNYKEMVYKENLDLIIILVSIDQIFKVSKDVIKYKIPLLIEKPPGLNCYQSKNLVNLSKKFKTPIFVALNRRFFSNFRKGIKIAEEYGGIKNIVIEGHERFWKVKKKKKIISDNWLYANSIHTIDLIRFFGGEVKKISRLKKSLYKKKGDQFLSIIEFKNGIIGSYFSNWYAPGGWSVKLFCNGVTIIFNPLENGYYIKKDMVKKPIELDKVDQIYKPGFYRQISLIIKYLQTQKIDDNLQTIFSAHQTMKLINKIS